MRIFYSTFTLVFLFILMGASYAQVKFSGSYRGSAYLFEDLNNETQTDFYNNFRFRLGSKKNPGLYLNTYFRLVRRGASSDWDDRFYNLYLHWKLADQPVYFNLGRQFLYNGVINGTVDGVLMALKPSDKSVIKLVAGVQAPYLREFKTTKWNEGNAVGGYFSYKFSQILNANISYYQVFKNDVRIWQLTGAAFNGIIVPDFYYQAQLDYNINDEKMQTIRARLTYYYNKWSFSGEYNSQKPRIYEDSYFRIFEVETFNQIRSAVTYQLSKIQLGLQYLFTSYDEGESTNQIILTTGNRWGLIGLLYQSGFGGDNFGLYGDIRYEFIPKLTAKLYGSYYNYQLHTTEITQDASAFSAGLIYHPIRPLGLWAEVQQSANPVYKNDVRGLFRVEYNFRY